MDRKWVINAKPFLKWAGSKTQLLKDLSIRLPESIIHSHKIDCYVEPFIGGGSMFFYLKNNYDIKKSYIFDVNKGLIIGYKIIKVTPHLLIHQLQKIEKEYNRSNNKEQFYLTTRKDYNDNGKKLYCDDINSAQFDTAWVLHAAQLIFLNRTCYNGLYRQNCIGEFNVPYGDYKNPKICDEKNILQVNKALENTQIFCDDFVCAAKYIDKDTFVYLDPPYRPLNLTSKFTNYTKEGFGDKDQTRLASFFKEMDMRGAYLMLSNSCPKIYPNEPAEADYFKELYNPFVKNFDKVYANRMINCYADKRGKIAELIITNYNNTYNIKQNKLFANISDN